MKKSLILTLAFLSAALFGAEKNYFYHQGKKVYLTEKENSFTLVAKKELDKSFLKTAPILAGKNKYIFQKLDNSLQTKLLSEGKLFPGYVFDSNGRDAFIEGSIFVKPKNPMSEKEMKNWCSANGYKFISSVRLAPGFFVISTDENPVDAARTLVETGIMSDAEPDFFLKVDFRESNFIPDDEFFNKQWYIYNDGTQGAKGMDYTYTLEAWRFLKENNIEPGFGVKLAILDDGFDLNHEDLAPNIADSKNFAPNEPLKGQIYDSDDTHGTRCAGIAGAAYDNGAGIAGVCPNCELYLGRFASEGFSSFQEIINMFDWAEQQGARIISNSWSVYYADATYLAALKSLRDKGIIVVFASGNEFKSCETGDDFATNENSILVGATDSYGIRSSYSNYCSQLDLVAPGAGYTGSPQGGGTEYDHLWTTDISGWNGESDSDYVGFIGTSASTPLVAGVIGLIFSANPGLNFDLVYDVLTSTADKGQDNSYVNGKSIYYGYGRVNALEAVKKAIAIDTTCTENSCPEGYTCNTSTGKCEKSSTPENDTDIITNDTDTTTNDTTPTNDSTIPADDSSNPVNDSTVPTDDSSNPADDSINPVDDSSNPTNDSNVNPINDEEEAVKDETSGCGCSLIF